MRRSLLQFICLVLAFATLISTGPQIRSSAAAERSTTDRVDDSLDPQIHVMYVLPSDGVDAQIDINGAIAKSVDLWNRWLVTESYGFQLRLDTYQGALDVTFFKLSKTDKEVAATGALVRDEIEAELKAANFVKPDKVYAVYYGGSSTFACGGGAWPPELPGVVAALYLNGTPEGAPACNTNKLAGSDEPQYLEFAMLHEIFHTVGAVAMCAPHQTQRGHVSDSPNDLMYAGKEPWTPSVLDIGRDDYWGHNIPGCLDMSKSPYIKAAKPIENACSPSSSTETSVIVMNYSDQPVTLNWVDDTCKEIPYGEIAPGQAFTQPTYIGHIWRVRDSKSNGILKTFTAQKDTGTVAVTACSPGTDKQVTLTVFNKTSQQVALNWVDFDCKEIPYGVIEPGDSFVQPTFTGHIWIVRDTKTNQPIKVFAAKQTGTVTIP